MADLDYVIVSEVPIKQLFFIFTKTQLLVRHRGVLTVSKN